VAICIAFCNFCRIGHPAKSYPIHMMRCVLIPSVVFGFVMCGVEAVTLTSAPDLFLKFAQAVVPFGLGSVFVSDRSGIDRKFKNHRDEKSVDDQRKFDNVEAMISKQIGLGNSICEYAIQASNTNKDEEFVLLSESVESYVNSANLDKDIDAKNLLGNMNMDSLLADVGIVVDTQLNDVGSFDMNILKNRILANDKCSDALKTIPFNAGLTLPANVFLEELLGRTLPLNLAGRTIPPFMITILKAEEKKKWIIRMQEGLTTTKQ